MKYTDKFIECTLIKCHCIKIKKQLNQRDTCSSLYYEMVTHFRWILVLTAPFCGCFCFYEREIEYSSHTNNIEWMNIVHHVHRNLLRYILYFWLALTWRWFNYIINMNGPLIDMAEICLNTCVYHHCSWRHCRKFTQKLILFKQEHQ